MCRLVFVSFHTASLRFVTKSVFFFISCRECYPHKPVSGQCLRELSEFCLPLVNCPQAKPLVERILCCQKSLDLISSEHENSLCVFDSVSVVFLRAVSSRRDLLLSYEARTALWKRF
ncbi:PREDICTED: uncharacterized protein LOC107341299 isoform X2 [Acropora digitifera]|uniref:uncharacterized protein LOC107341299 isoform X2 n=1 Tax=Acropora digitifera TaxID=70779 RepID=UPI00077A7FD5|nr:PREDICTED: uncharacterized protein LOC107341299 isoform X2 [Acropora digitifera]